MKLKSIESLIEKFYPKPEWYDFNSSPDYMIFPEDPKLFDVLPNLFFHKLKNKIKEFFPKIDEFEITILPVWCCDNPSETLSSNWKLTSIIIADGQVFDIAEIGIKSNLKHNILFRGILRKKALPCLIERKFYSEEVPMELVAGKYGLLYSDVHTEIVKKDISKEVEVDIKKPVEEISEYSKKYLPAVTSYDIDEEILKQVFGS